EEETAEEEADEEETAEEEAGEEEAGEEEVAEEEADQEESTESEAAPEAADEAEAAKVVVPEDAYDLPLMTLGLPTKVENLLDDAGVGTVGELADRILSGSDSISDIDGIGPSYLEQIESALEVMIGSALIPDGEDADQEQEEQENQEE
ncbi:MAG: hypothetical protein ACK2TZ_10910, partial [Anaerolineales bacterium]